MILILHYTYHPWAGHLDVVKLLLKHGVDLNAQDKNHEIPWDHASSNGRRVVTQFLLERSAVPCSHQDRDWGSLHTASKNGHLDVVRSLLRRGEDVNLRNMKQETPALLESGNGNIEVRGFFLKVVRMRIPWVLQYCITWNCVNSVSFIQPAVIPFSARVLHRGPSRPLCKDKIIHPQMRE